MLGVLQSFSVMLPTGLNAPSLQVRRLRLGCLSSMAPETLLVTEPGLNPGLSDAAAAG